MDGWQHPAPVGEVPAVLDGGPGGWYAAVLEGLAAGLVKLAWKSRIDERYSMSYKDKAGKSTSDVGEFAQLACRKCFALTSRQILADHGGQCYPCFQDYCRTAPANYRAGQSETHTGREMKSHLRRDQG